MNIPIPMIDPKNLNDNYYDTVYFREHIINLAVGRLLLILLYKRERNKERNKNDEELQLDFWDINNALNLGISRQEKLDIFLNRIKPVFERENWLIEVKKDKRRIQGCEQGSIKEENWKSYLKYQSIIIIFKENKRKRISRQEMLDLED